MLTVSFMIRNTSPIGWPPMLLIKIVRDRSLVPFLIAGVAVFIPVVLLSIGVDSFYYGQFPVVTAYNFVQANLAEGLSKYFGTEPFHFYVLAVMPLIFTVAYPSVLAAFYVYGRDKIQVAKGGEPPYMLHLSAFYLLVFSTIQHKEPRFLLPIVPFCFLMLGYFLAKIIKGSGNCMGKFLKFYIWLAIIVELAMAAFFLKMQFRNWEPLAYL
jgi:GPI mannosyltransferase 3